MRTCWALTALKIEIVDDDGDVIFFLESILGI